MFDLICMIQLFKGIASEADALLNDLQSSLHTQEEKLCAYAQQQREVCNWLCFWTFTSEGIGLLSLSLNKCFYLIPDTGTCEGSGNCKVSF